MIVPVLRPAGLVLRSLAYYWRTNLAVGLGVATAVAVLAGALLVGESVRASLRDLVVRRLGRTDLVVVSTGYFREQLAGDLRDDPAFDAAFDGVAPMIAAPGVAREQAGGRSSRVQVYGVDDRFWDFHRATGVEGPGGREALVSEALAEDTGAGPGATLLVRLQRPSDVPVESLHGRKDDLSQTVRVTVREILEPDRLGEFALSPQQGRVRALFVPLSRLQQDLGVGGRANALLVSGSSAASGTGEALEALVRRHAALEDVGLRLRVLDRQGVIAVESDAGLIDDRKADAIRAELTRSGYAVRPVLTYLANSLRAGDRDVPYSLVTATDLSAIAPAAARGVDQEGPPPVVLNDWAARDLQVREGDRLTMDYYVWEDPGRLETRTAEFQVAGIVPIGGAAADPDLAPDYPGITGAISLGDWDPPFPIDLGRIRPADEDYWDDHRTTPKAFIPLEAGQALWRSRYGALTSIRVLPRAGETMMDARRQTGERLRAALDPVAIGLMVRDVRAEGLAASRGATDFGEYFTYFSFFLVVSALLLTALFFKLGIEQRAREIGLLRAVGFGTKDVGRLFAGEGLVLALVSGAVGLAGAVGYAYLLMTGLRTWWVDAVGTTALALHVTPGALAGGVVGGLAAAMICIAWTLRGLGRVSERGLMAGRLVADEAGPGLGRRPRRLLAAAVAFAGVGGALVIGASTGAIGQTGGFFGAGAALLAASFCVLSARLRRPAARPVEGRGWLPVSRLGLRSLAYRPGRSVLAAAVMASASFILISVDAFRRDDRASDTGPRSGIGGYSVLVEVLLPVVHDPAGADGLERLGLAGMDASVEPFRVLPGDDASCLNLYEPTNPRILAPRASFVQSGRFSFRDSLADTEAERANPWLLLDRDLGEGVVPVIADANSMTYVLHREVGDELVLTRGGRTIRLRFVGALADSIFQSELLMSEARFLDLFPRQEGYGLLLVETPPGGASAAASAIEERLADSGADATLAVERLARFHSVENTYLSTFQTLGGFGLLLGTVGLGAVLLRNVLERRQELALLGAVGYRRAHFLAMFVVENGVLLAFGLTAGTVCALIAIAPAAAERGARFPLNTGLALTLAAVFAAGLLSSMIAARAATRAPLVETLRSE